MTYQRVVDYVKAEPFRPFRIHMASGRTFDIRHPELIKVLKNYILIFKTGADGADVPDELDTVSLMLIEYLSHLEGPVHQDK
jgi:hypothetical protein